MMRCDRILLSYLSEDFGAQIPELANLALPVALAPVSLVTLGVVLVHFFFFNDTATTEIYTLSLHDALPISDVGARCRGRTRCPRIHTRVGPAATGPDHPADDALHARGGGTLRPRGDHPQRRRCRHGYASGPPAPCRGRQLLHPHDLFAGRGDLAGSSAGCPTYRRARWRWKHRGPAGAGRRWGHRGRSESPRRSGPAHPIAAEGRTQPGGRLCADRRTAPGGGRRDRRPP